MSDDQPSTPQPPSGPPQQYGPAPQPPSGQPPQYGPAPQYRQPYPGQAVAMPLSPSDERTWGLAAHLAPFVAGVVGLPFLGPLVVYLIFKDRSAFVRRHAAASTNFQLSLLIYALAGLLLSVVTLGLAAFVVIPVAIAVGVAAIILQILAAMAASRGQEYHYPLTLPLVS